MANKTQGTRNFMRAGGISVITPEKAKKLPSSLLRNLQRRAAREQLAELPGKAKQLLAELARKKT
ncbi:MAG: hypothetical protein HY847_16985 [Betaproteobacteria bacterium]|nr:hypothetical protein [Betaproteobacteria bacterium]